jgi:hypothetical protein
MRQSQRQCRRRLFSPNPYRALLASHRQPAQTRIVLCGSTMQDRLDKQTATCPGPQSGAEACLRQARPLERCQADAGGAGVKAKAKDRAAAAMALLVMFISCL